MVGIVSLDLNSWVCLRIIKIVENSRVSRNKSCLLTSLVVFVVSVLISELVTQAPTGVYCLVTAWHDKRYTRQLQ